MGACSVTETMFCAPDSLMKASACRRVRSRLPSLSVGGNINAQKGDLILADSGSAKTVCSIRFMTSSSPKERLDDHENYDKAQGNYQESEPCFDECAPRIQRTGLKIYCQPKVNQRHDGPCRHHQRSPEW
jgi:hypothetical protein